MSSHALRIVVIAGLMVGLCGSAHASFTGVTLPNLNLDIRTLGDGATYNPLFPSNPTYNGVPFNLVLDAEGHNAWFKNGSTAATLDIPVNVFGATKVYTIINTLFGVSGATTGAVEFLGSGGSDFTVSLVEGVNVRDHFDGFYVNTIDDVTAVPAFNVGPKRARLDMQIFTLPDSFADETLTTIRFTSAGSDPAGIPFLVAATVQTGGPEPPIGVIPVPGALLLVAIGATAVDLLRRRRALL